MISIYGLYKSYGLQVLFEDALLQMSAGERIGLVGRNGHGKSTLFRILLGEERADQGKMTFPKNYRIGHLAQHIRFTQPTVLEEGCLGLPHEEQYDHYKVEQILFGLGFTKKDMNRAPSEFSGGFQIRLNLAKVLVSRPNLLLLDEPTNYLDIISIRWITRFLNSWEGEMILISHDREFMDNVTTHTALIHRKKIRKIEGPTGKIYAQIAEEEAIHEKSRINEEKQRRHLETFVNRFRAQATKASAVQSRIKMLDKMPRLEKLSDAADLDFRFHYAPFPGKNVMDVSEVSFHYDPAVPLIHRLSFTVGAKDRIGIIGKNGRGKSTLLNILAGELIPCSGSVRPNTNQKIGFFGQTNVERLRPEYTIEKEVSSANSDLSRTQVRGICGMLMFSGDQAEKKISVLSGGEKSRVLLGKVVATPVNLLLLDEPTNHLDMQSVEAFADSIQEFPGAVIIVTHNEMMLRNVVNRLIVFQGMPYVFNGTYDDFLEKVGWDEESEGKRKSASPVGVKRAAMAPSPSHSSQRSKSLIGIEQSYALDQLKRQITALEEEISRKEEEIPVLHENLAEASVQNNVDGFVTLSKSLKEAQKALDKDYKTLEKITKQYEDKSRAYQRRLSAFGAVGLVL